MGKYTNQINMMKTCRKCKQEKNIELFVKSKDSIGGYMKICKKCRHQDIKEWIIKNKDKMKDYNQKYQKLNIIKFYINKLLKQGDLLCQ